MTNYFEFYELPVQLNLDLGVLRRAYFEKSRQYHPDHYQGLEEEALYWSGLNNQAYECLRQFASRLSHILDLFGEEQRKTNPQDPIFLMEMMNYNESLENLQNNPQAAQELAKNIEAIENQLIQSFLDQSPSLDPQAPQADLLKKMAVLEKKLQFFLRIRKNALILAMR